MPPRAAIHNGIITVVILFFMLLLAMLLKARYRLHKEPVKAIPVAEAVAAPKAIPVAVPIEEVVQEARAYRQGEWWVLPEPKLVPGRANEPDTLRIRSGPKEDVFVLYFVDAAEIVAARPKRLKEQSSSFQNPSTDAVLSAGASAMDFVNTLLTKNSFKVYTKWERVPESERYYGFITVELEQGKHLDLGEMLVFKGFALPRGHQISGLPAPLPKSDKYVLQLGKALSQAKAEHAGAWAKAE
jgi:hypothetical protein